LEITPRFLERVAGALRHAQLDLVSLDEMHRRLTEGDFRRRFICLTIDDGYRDTLEYAYPILKQYEIPFGIYVATSFADRLGELWWLVLEAVVARSVQVGLTIDGQDRRFECATVEQKRETFDAIYGWLRSLESEDDLRAVIRDLGSRYHVDIGAFCRELCMSWQELEQIAADPLVTIGAHTVNHVMLAKVSAKAAEAEIAMSRRVIEGALGQPVEHLCYPVGDPTSAGPREFALAAKLGFKTAVTTRPGVLYPEHREHLTALPRISINGEYQQMRYLRVLMSGAATAVWNRFQRVNAA
jgi:peptidoglycan/xylan/chitin deacetylase (PgdA/CDA1 family)